MADTLTLTNMDVQNRQTWVHTIRQVERQAIIHADRCKGCGLCVANCPNQVLAMGHEINAMGYRAAVVCNGNCAGCGVCYYSCPEPDAISLIPIRSLANQEVLCPV